MIIRIKIPLQKTAPTHDCVSFLFLNSINGCVSQVVLQDLFIFILQGGGARFILSESCIAHLSYSRSDLEEITTTTTTTTMHYWHVVFMSVPPLKLRCKNEVKQKSTQEDLRSAWQGRTNMAAVNVTTCQNAVEVDSSRLTPSSRDPLILGQSTYCGNTSSPVYTEIISIVGEGASLISPSLLAVSTTRTYTRNQR